MEIPSKSVFEVLKEKGVDSICHANSVITACQFLRLKSLLSRGTVERKGLYQTSQKSDQLDQRLGIWFDIFTDSVDIHKRARRANAYGPVLFKFDSEIIQDSYTGKVWVTKLNPTKWKGKGHESRWFTSIDDLKTNFVKGSFDQMIVFRHCGGELPFGNFLQEVVLDDPERKSPNGIDYYSMAFGALTFAKTEGASAVIVKKRKCVASCSCAVHYKTNLEITREMFFPKPF